MRWSLLVLALLCLLPTLYGGWLVVEAADGREAVGFAIVGFFGAGSVVLARRAFDR